MKPLSLRGKIVVMASVVVAAACLFLTVISITSANKYMRSLVSYDTTSSVQALPPPIPPRAAAWKTGFKARLPRLFPTLKKTGCLSGLP